MSEQLSIFLDESGDLGFDFEKPKTTKYFVITLLVCKNKKAVEYIERAVLKTLRHKVNYKAKTIKHELKGTETTIKTKNYFYYQANKNSDWSIYSVILNKQKLLRKLGEAPIHKNLYNHLAHKIIEQVNFNHPAKIARLIVDRSKNNQEIKEFNHYIANHLAAFLPLSTKLIIEHQTSTESNGLQAVDLFSWGIFKKCMENDLNWYEIYKDRIEVEDETEIKKTAPTSPDSHRSMSHP